MEVQYMTYDLFKEL